MSDSFDRSPETFEEMLEQTREEAKAKANAARTEREAQEAEFKSRSFRLFSQDSAEWHETATLAELLSRLPAGARPEDVTLGYAGCGSHDVDVSWAQEGTPGDGPSDHSSPWDQITMTAGAMIEELRKLPPDKPVIVRTPDWFLNVRGVEIETDLDIAATVQTADDYDPRQW